MIIGISGKAGSGKDTVAELLVRDHGFVRIGLADPMKRFAQAIWAFSDAQLWGPSSHRNAADPRYRRADGLLLTPRHALQQLGTEWGRACDPDVWIRYALRVAEALVSERARRYEPELGLVWDAEAAPARGVVIPDIRFRNELAAIRNAGGQVWRVMRGSGLAGEAGQHPSEAEQDGIADHEFDRLIANHGSLIELPGLVRSALMPEAAE